MTRKPILVIALVALLLVSCSPGENGRAGGGSQSLQAVDPYTLKGDFNLVTDFAARNADGSINVVIEIPAGTNAKWEVDKSDGSLRWEIVDGKPRVVQYLPYPANYGMVPRTLLPEALGGDGDPLDVVVLGPAHERGSVVKARIIGVLNLIDSGETDDKLIAVDDGSHLSHLQDISDLIRQYPGVTDILQTWFTSYKGPGVLKSPGFGDRKQAGEILSQAVAAYAEK